MLPEVAYYYPNPVWRDGDWVKSLILFFEGVAILVPEYMRNRPYELDPAITSGLSDNGLLHVLEPERVIDEAMATKLSESLLDIVTSGALDNLEPQDRFEELSMSRAGYAVFRSVAELIVEELQKKGLALPTRDGVSLPMHPQVRQIYLVILSQLMRDAGPQLGLNLFPTTDSPEVNENFARLLSHPQLPSAGHVIATDMEIVGIDLGPVPIDEVLDFRRENGKHFRAYAQGLRRLVKELGEMNTDERERALSERRDDIRDEVNDLRQKSKLLGAKPASVGFGLAGAIWTVILHNPIAATLAAGGALSSALAGKDGQQATAYSYLLRAGSRFQPY